MSQTTKTAERLRATLRAEARQISHITTSADDAPERSVRRLDAAPPVGAERRDHRPWLLAAAAAVVVVAAAGVAVVSRDDAPNADMATRGNTDSPSGEVTLASAAGTLVPEWVPEDLTLWQAEWVARPAGVADDRKTQLLGRDGSTENGAIFIQLQDSDGILPDGDSVTVRGQEGRVAEAKEYAGTTSTISFIDGVWVDASFTGLSLDEAVAVLDGLSWRSGDHSEGFAPPAAGSDGFTMLGETGPSTDAAVLNGSFRYSDAATNWAVGQGRQLEVRTMTSSGEGISVEYLQTWFHGTVGPDGVIQSYEPQFGTLRRDWPNGQSIWIDANGTPIDEATLVQVADSVTSTTDAKLALLQAQLSVLAASQPLVASVTFDAATVDIRGTDMTAGLCIHPTGADVVCAVAGGDGTDELWMSQLVGDTWYVVGATKTEPPRVVEAASQQRQPPPDASAPNLPGETASAGGWNFVLVAVPDDVPFVEVRTGNFGSGPIARPLT